MAYKLTFIVGGKEISADIVDFELTMDREDTQDLPLRIDYQSISGISGSFEGNVNPEVYEPLGIIDHLTWGPLLN